MHAILPQYIAAEKDWAISRMSRQYWLSMSGSLLAIVTVSTPAAAETALQVRSWCHEVAAARFTHDNKLYMTSTFDSGFCWGAFGALQDLGDATLADKKRLLGFCAPSDRIQLIRVFMRYVDQHPETGNRSFAEIAARALIEAFPCQESTN